MQLLDLSLEEMIQAEGTRRKEGDEERFNMICSNTKKQRRRLQINVYFFIR